jgi:hypothetical protein
MTGPRPAGLPWTRAEDDQLRAMFEAGMKSPAIALKLRRTADAVRVRKTVLNKREAGLRAKGKLPLRRLRGHLKKKGFCDRWRRLAKASRRFQLCSSAHPMQYASRLKYSRSSWPVRSQGGSRRENTSPDNKLSDSTSDIVSAAQPSPPRGNC